nr:DNA-binding protein [Acidovorax sp. SUPP3334]
MAREGVTYEQVKAAAEEMLGEGREPSIRAVRERLRGTGSPNTIHRHLSKWRASRPDAPAPTMDLPASILREINGEIQRAASAARAEVEAQLAQALTEAADLAAAGEALEAERDELAEQAATLTSERDVQAGKAAEQLAEIERLGQDVERERRALEEARIEIAQSRLKLDAQKAQLAEQRGQLDQQAQDLRTEQQSRIAAERDLAAASTARDGLADRVKELQGREQAALRDVSELRARADTGTSEARAAASEVARLLEALTRESAEAERLRDQAKHHQEASTVSARDVARLQEALSRVTEESDRFRAETTALREQVSAVSVENARLKGLLNHDAAPAAPAAPNPRKGT